MTLETPVADLFSSIASGYDFLNRVLSMGIDIYWRRVLVRSVAGVLPGPILDLAAGTLDVSLLLARCYPERSILAGDLCFDMISQGMPKLERQRRKHPRAARVVPMAANAFCLPLASSTMSAVTVSFGLRNMAPRLEALKEIRRVLKPGGRLVVLEFGSARVKLWKGLYNFYLAKIMPRVGGLVSGRREAYDYLARTIREFPLHWELEEEILRAGFSQVSSRPLAGGIAYMHSADN